MYILLNTRRSVEANADVTEGCRRKQLEIQSNSWNTGQTPENYSVVGVLIFFCEHWL